MGAKISLAQYRSDLCEPMRRSFEIAADHCLNYQMRAYVIVALDVDDMVHVHRDAGVWGISLLGALAVAKDSIIREDL